MEELPHFLVVALGTASYIKYPLIFLGSIVEGPVLMLASGFLLRLEVVSAVPLYSALLLGDLVGDVVWYCVGRFFAEPVLRKHGKFLSLTPERFERIKEIFRKRHSSILFFSKITMGFGMAIWTLMTAGASHIRFRTYMFFNIVGGFFFVAMLLSIGYIFGQIYDLLAEEFKYIFLFGASVIALLAIWGFSRYIRSKIASL